ncbi:MAG: hypothetical protein QOF25_1059, partial [Mycobacterium sp.]|nr:hypothetical protein [Mycobacterium sp.]
MTSPTVTQAQAWRPDSLREAADAWDRAASDLRAHVGAVVRVVDSSSNFWTGQAADAARDSAATLSADGAALARTLVTAAVTARDGADQLAVAQADVAARVDEARAEGFEVGDDGTVSPSVPPALLIALSGGDAGVARELFALRAAELTRHVVAALEALGGADRDAAHDIDEAFASRPITGAAPTAPSAAWPVQAGDVVAGWPSMSQHRIADQIAAMTAEQRGELVDGFPRQVGNTDGVPWDMRAEANRINIAQAILDETGTDPDAKRRIAFYQELLREVDDLVDSGHRVDRRILAFDAGRSTLVEF